MSRLVRALAIRPGEAPLVAVVALAFAAVEAGRGLGEVAVDTLVLSRAGASALPYLYVGLGLAGLVATAVYSAALTRAPAPRFFPALLAVLGLALALEWLAALSGAAGAYPLLWISVYVVGAVLTTALWTVAGRVFHARQARRLFPLCTSAAIAGSFAGLIASGPLTRIVGAEALVLAEASFVGLAALALARLGHRLRVDSPGGGASAVGRISVLASLRIGAAHVVRSPLMRLVAVAYLLFAVLLFSVAFPFLRAMSSAFPGEADLATALGLLSAAVTATSFVVSALFANRLFARFGVALMAVALPVVYLGGFALWLVGFSLATAIAFRFVQQVVQRGVSNAAWNSLFNVVPASRRGQVLAFLDGVPGQLGTILSGVLLLVAASLAQQEVFVLGFVTAAALVVVAWGIRRRYASTIVATLREGLSEQVIEGGPGLAGLARDPAVVADLRRALHAERAAERRLAVDLLVELNARDALPDIKALVADTDPMVRCAAIEALRRLGGSAARDAIAVAASDPDADVRTAAVRNAALIAGDDAGWLVTDVLPRVADDTSARVQAELAVALCRIGRTGDGRAIAERLLQGDQGAQITALGIVARVGGAPLTPLAGWLDSPDPAIRAAAFAALGAGTADAPSTARLVAGLSDAAAPVRAAVAQALAARPGVANDAIATLETGGEAAQGAALAALEGKGDLVRPRLVAWAIGQVNRSIRLRQFAAGLDTPPDPAAAGRPVTDGTASAAFLGDILRMRGASIEIRLLQALALLGAPDAAGLIRRSLRSVHAETRAQAIEALEELGDGGLARAVVSLLDTDPGRQIAVNGQVAVIARVLLDDADPWVRALAIRTLDAHLATERRAVIDRARGDPDPIVRSAIEAGLVGGEPHVPESRATLGEIDRMLLLRRVPLFAALAPEDLQRLAATATERLFEGGQALVREGDLGNELIVLVEGSVRVIRAENGTERLLRRYEAGDHIGELAVLREGPRAATVVADEPGVRGLVIGGDGLRAILRERPDAAMAMLATLAERISRQ